MPDIFSCSIINPQAHSKPLLETVPSVDRDSLGWREWNGFSWDHLKERVPNISNIFIIGHLRNTVTSRSFRQWIVCFTILQSCWTWCEAQQVMELATASHKAMKLQARYMKSRALRFIVFYFISRSQITFFEKKKPKTKQNHPSPLQPIKYM